MVFSSTIFLFYFLPVFFLLYYIVNHKLKNFVALTASVFFYAWGAPDFVFVVIASIIADYYLVKKMHSAASKQKKIYLSTSILLNIGLLAYFKYANFFVENVNEFLLLLDINPMQWTAIALPIGISFFTFQKFTYSIDVYRGLYKPLNKLSDLCLYILLFPQLIAGPIVRYSEIAEQLEDRRNHENFDNRLTGLFRFIIGLSKKVLIANVMGEMADDIFGTNVSELDSYLAWIGILAYTFQIYFDLSGYSDMAIGLGKMMGFRFPENFNNPYISQNISEFWRRWHITLGRWMKDYLYIPLGGNKVESKYRLFFNLWLVFLISGLWHGAAWTFVVWGAYHGLFLILDRMFLIKILNKIGKIPSIIFTFWVTIFGWVLFRSESLKYAYDFSKKLLAFEFISKPELDDKFVSIFIIAVIFSFITFWNFGRKIENKVFFSPYSNRRYIFMSVICFVLLVIAVASINASGFNPFIYFRF